MTETIDVTPTWSGVIRLLIAGVENGSESAREEIIRLARQYDAACDEIEELEAALKNVAIWMEQYLVTDIDAPGYIAGTQAELQAVKQVLEG